MHGDHENDLLPAGPHNAATLLPECSPEGRGMFLKRAEREQKEWRELSGLIQENGVDGRTDLGRGT